MKSLRLYSLFALILDKDAITNISVNVLKNGAMFVSWIGPAFKYTVNVWTPNGISLESTKSSDVAFFQNLTDTKPYYVSIRPALDGQGGCLPKPVMAGMIYLNATGNSNALRCITSFFVLQIYSYSFTTCKIS